MGNGLCRQRKHEKLFPGEPNSSEKADTDACAVSAHGFRKDSKNLYIDKNSVTESRMPSINIKMSVKNLAAAIFRVCTWIA